MSTVFTPRCRAQAHCDHPDAGRNECDAHGNRLPLRCAWQRLTLDVADIDVGRVGDHQLPWVNLQQRDADAIRGIAAQLSLHDVPVADLLNTADRPKIERFGYFYRLFIISAEVDDDGKLERMPIDFLVGRNVIVTISDGPVDYFEELLQRDRGETTIGALDAEGFLTTLLDLHIVSYFRAIESVESAVDQVDKRVPLRDLDERDFLTNMVRRRSHVSRLRRWFLPHRDILLCIGASGLPAVGRY